jgi:hypothetical protein
MCDLKGSMLKVKQNILYTEHKVYWTCNLY